LIRSTAHLASSGPPADRDTATILDADLAILGAAEARYQRYSEEIRKEYAWVSEEDYRTGRAGVLKSFLSRPRIFIHQITFEEGEKQARFNIAAELARLEA
jgi:predicted metal-dependent HD superfamily phosphohydrolase